MADSMINGLELPDLLMDLMERNQWKRPKNTDALRALTGMRKPEKLDFLKLRKMGAESKALFDLYHDGHGDLYGLVYDDPAAADKLDVHRMIVLAVNDDEEGIALDYRGAPSVIVGAWSGSGDDERMVWRTIAPDFETFARQIGLIT